MSLRLICKTSKSLVVPVLRGAENDDDDDQNDDASGEDGQDGDGGEGSEDPPGKKDGDVISKEEYDKVVDRMKAADRNKSEVEKRLKEYEDKDKDEITKATERADALEQENASLKERLSALSFENAFALNSKYSWHDPQVVLEILRKRDDVTIDEDGAVKGLDKALDAIAKEKKFLLKDKDSDDGDDAPPPAGSGTGSGRRRDSKPDETAIRKKYRI